MNGLNLDFGMNKQGCAAILALVIGLTGSAVTARAQQDFADVEIETLHVREDIYMLVGGGGNVTVQVGGDGVLIVDSQFAQLSGKIIAAISRLTDQPIRFIVNTHHHGDHVGGNENLRVSGDTVTGGNMPGPVPYAGEGAAGYFARERAASSERDHGRTGSPSVNVADQCVFQ